MATGGVPSPSSLDRDLLARVGTEPLAAPRGRAKWRGRSWWDQNAGFRETAVDSAPPGCGVLDEGNPRAAYPPFEDEPDGVYVGLRTRVDFGSGGTGSDCAAFTPVRQTT
jgi:hypothetical protein